MAKYKQYDASGNALNGEYGKIFEEEYKAVAAEWQAAFGEDEYLNYRIRLLRKRLMQDIFQLIKRITSLKVKSPISVKTFRMMPMPIPYNEG